MPRSHLWSLAPILLRLVVPSGVQKEWVHVGARQVNLQTDHDVLRATGDARFKRIRLVVEGSDLEMFDVRITFGDGATFTPATHFSFKANSKSHVIVLPGAARIVRWIDFYYRSVPARGHGKATVHLYGRG
ncbi:MAG TPA: hypothetical protein VNH14_15445 [Gemmatimonadales bacterium]|nr:hypothetical protein [Gemmatimonadales bacterium]